MVNSTKPNQEASTSKNSETISAPKVPNGIELQVEKYFSTGTISQAIIKLQKHRDDFDADVVESDVSVATAIEFQFQGFDANTIFTALIGKAKTFEVLKADVMTMAILFLVRGNNVTKMQKSMTQAGLTKLTTLVSRYGIVPNLANKDKRKTITLARVGMTLPTASIMAMSVLHRLYSPPIRSCLNNLHCLIRQQTSAAYLTKEIASHVELLFLASSVVLGSVIGDKDDTLGKTRAFIKAAQNSNRLSVQRIQKELIDRGVADPPLNWSSLEPELSKILAPKNDRALLSEIVGDVSKVMDEISPPDSWSKYVHYAEEDEDTVINVTEESSQ